MTDEFRDEDYRTLAEFRFALRSFLHFSEEAAQAAGLTARQYQALLAIRAEPDSAMLVGTLAERLLLRPHSATELINRMAALDLVQRTPSASDRRQVTVKLTPHGRDVLASLAGMHRTELRQLGPMLSALLSQI